MNIKRFLIGAASGALMLGSMATAVFAAPPPAPGTYGTAASNAQCDSGASSGAFNFQNEIYGEPSSLNNSLNSSEFGLAGGSGGGQTGINNSSVCGNSQN